MSESTSTEPQSKEGIARVHIRFHHSQQQTHNYPCRFLILLFHHRLTLPLSLHTSWLCPYLRSTRDGVYKGCNIFITRKTLLLRWVSLRILQQLKVGQFCEGQQRCQTYGTYLTATNWEGCLDLRVYTIDIGQKVLFFLFHLYLLIYTQKGVEVQSSPSQSTHSCQKFWWIFLLWLIVEFYLRLNMQPHHILQSVNLG